MDDLPVRGALGGDNDQLPVGGADGEGLGVSFFENARDVRNLLAVTWAGPPPADHDALAGIGRCEPDLQPLVSLRLGFCSRDILALPAGDVAGDILGVVGQRTGLGGAAR